MPEELVNGHLKVYNFVRENGCVTAAEAEKLLGVKSRRARKVLKGLVEGKWLEKVGASSSTRYVVQR